jgi:hypothetical protein
MFDIIRQLNDTSSSNYGINRSRLSEEQAASVVNFKNFSGNLLNSLNNLVGRKNDGSNVFGALMATSSDTDALSVSYKTDVDRFSSEALRARRDPNYTGHTPTSFAVQTLQLAQTQRNTSALKSNEMALDAERTYRFEIQAGSQTRTYSFVTESGDTNESVHNKIAAAINADKDSAVRASVVRLNDTGETQLVIESRQTGLQSGAFEIRDRAGYDAISRIGANNITQNAQNAEYMIGELDTARSTSSNVVLRGSAELRTSESNNIDVDDRTSITLRRTTENYVAVNFERNTTEGINAVRELVNSFNYLYEQAHKNNNNNRSAMLLNQLSSHAQTYIKQLHELGISRNDQGFLTIDEDRMKTAAEGGSLERFFLSDSGASSYGFTSRLTQIAKTVNDNPLRYVGESVRGDGDANVNNAQRFWQEFNAGSPNYSRLYFNLQRQENIGMLFNSMF